MRSFIKGSRMSLAADIAQCISSEDVGLKWTKLAEKDLEDVEMYSEEEFQSVLKKAQERLAAETLRLCAASRNSRSRRCRNERGDRQKPTYADLLLLIPKRTRRKRKKNVLPEGVEQLTLFAV